MTIETYVATAAKRDAERSRIGGNLGWYLRHEFRGGSTLEAILAENGAERHALWTALGRTLKQLRVNRRQANSADVTSEQ